MILILTTGGTIASTSSTQIATRYLPTQNGSTLIDALHTHYGKHLKNEQFEVLDLLQIDSKNMRYHHIQSIQNALVDKLSQDKYTQAIVLCGTDNMESVVFSLHLNHHLHALQKPIIVTGAMRAFSEATSDGIDNMYDAIVWSNQLKKYKSTHTGLGNLVYAVMHQQLLAPYQVNKKDTLSVAAFDDVSPMGNVVPLLFFWQRHQFNLHFNTYYSKAFTAFSLNTLPIEILENITRLLAHIAAPIPTPDALSDASSQIAGVIIQGTGNGTYPENWQPFIDECLAKNKPIVRTSRCLGAVDWQKGDSTIASKQLSSDKVHLLLGLCLSNHIHDFDEIQTIIDEYDAVYLS